MSEIKVPLWRASRAEPEAPVLPPTAAAEAQPAAEPIRRDPLYTFFLGGLFTIALFTALYFTADLVLPLFLAFVLTILLQPAVHAAQRVYVPRVVSAILLIFMLAGALSGIGAVISGPAAQWAEKVPLALPRLEDRLKNLLEPWRATQKIIQQAEKAADGAAAETTAAVTVKSEGLASQIFTGTRAVLALVFTTLLLLFFLLVSGDLFLRRIVESLPRFRDKRQAVEIVQRIQGDISAYLITISVMNALVGLATAGIMYATGVADPLLWGVAAFLLNYVPILGPAFCVGLFAVVGLMSFEPLVTALTPAGLYLAIHLLEGELVTPMLLARRFTLNPVLVIVSIVVWFWMWGVAGAILAVPILAIAKVVCERIEPLRAIGHFIEG